MTLGCFIEFVANMQKLSIRPYDISFCFYLYKDEHWFGTYEMFLNSNWELDDYFDILEKVTGSNKCFNDPLKNYYIKTKDCGNTIKFICDLDIDKMD